MCETKQSGQMGAKEEQQEILLNLWTQCAAYSSPVSNHKLNAGLSGSL